MNVLMVIPWDNLGGVSEVVRNVAKHLESHGHGVVYLLPGKSTFAVPVVTRAGHPGYRVNRSRMAPSMSSVRSWVAFLASLPVTMFVLIRIVRKHRINVVNIHFPGSAGISFVIMRALGFFRIVTSVHGADLLPEGKRAVSRQIGLKQVLAHSDLLIVPSKGFQTALHEAWPELRPQPITVVPNGVDPAELGYVENGASKPATPPYILSILQLVEYKGADVLIRAFASVCGDYPDLRLKLGSDGPNRKDYEALTATLGIRDRVDFLGFLERPQIAAQLRGCTFFVLPSRTNSESFGIAAAEAMALDKAVIVSRIGGLPALVDDGESGLLVPPGDDVALASAIRRLLNDPAETERLGRNAGKRVRENFLWRNTGELYVQAYTRVINRLQSTANPELARQEAN